MFFLNHNHKSFRLSFLFIIFLIVSINFFVQVESSDSLQTELVVSDNSKVSESSSSEFVENCRICLQRKLYEFTLPCKHSFCESCIFKLTENKEDPFCPFCCFKLKNDYEFSVSLSKRKQMPKLLRIACSNGDLDALQVLIDKGAGIDRDRDLIHLVNMDRLDRLDIYKFLLQNGSDINNLDKYEFGRCLLYKACYKNDFDLVKFLLSEGANPKLLDKELIYLGMFKRNFKVLFLLIQSGADINYLNQSRHTLLSDACRNNDLVFVKFLLSKGANPKLLDYDISIIYFLFTESYFEVLFLVIQHGAEIHSLDKDSLLRIACSNGYFGALPVLIDKGAKLDKESIHLVNMNRLDRLDIYKLLIQNGADINALNQNKECLLYIACYRNDLELVKFLLSKGANSNILNSANSSPLNLALDLYLPNDSIQIQKNLDIVKALLGAGANINNKDIFFKTPLQDACARGLIESVIVLLDAGAIIDETFSLSIACSLNHLDVFKLLIDRGARLDDKILHSAVNIGHKEMVEYLILKKVNVNSVDKEGLTPLDLAYRRCDNPYVARDIIDILIAHDAVRSKK